MSPSASHSCSLFWHIINVVCVSDLAPCRQSFRRQRLVVVTILLLSTAVSLLVAAFVGFCALSSAASCCCRCFVVVRSGVTSCDWVYRLLRLVGGGVLSLQLAAASPQSKLTYHFVLKFQQAIGTDRKLFERFWTILFSQQVPGLRNLCKFALANGLAGWFISRYWVRAK